MNSTYEVKVYKVNNIEKHPNADSLGIIKLDGYQSIIKLDQINVGDLVAHIQPDSMINDVTRPEFKFLDRKNHGKPVRIKIAKLRGLVSHGLVVKAPEGSKENDNVADVLNVTHWNPPEPKPAFTVGKRWISVFYCLQSERSKGVIEGRIESNKVHENSLSYIPGIYFPKYDIENFRRYTKVFEDGELTFVTQKLHGSNCSYVFHGGQLYVRSRNLYQLDENTIYHRAITPEIRAFCEKHPDFALWGEVVNCQDKFNYGLPPGEVKFYAFDILQPDGKFLSSFDFLDLCDNSNIPTVPVVYKEWSFDVDVLNELVEMDCMITGGVCEGLVVKPVSEAWHPKIGRKFLKVVSNRYYELS
jgi:tRNA-binding EMAP/Myf-like protein